MKYLILFIKIVAVFDLCCLAVYLGGDIVSALIRKLRKKPAQSDDFYDFSMDGDTAAPLSKALPPGTAPHDDRPGAGTETG